MAGDDLQNAARTEEKAIIYEKMSELEDLMLINKLDLINLKNEVEKLRITAAVPSPEVMEGIKELADLAHDVDDFKTWKKVADDVKKLKEMSVKYKPVNIDNLDKNIRFLDQRMSMLEQAAGVGTQSADLAKEYEKQFEKLKAVSSASAAPDLSRKLAEVENKLHMNSQKIQSLASAMESPADVHLFTEKLQALAKRVEDLRQNASERPEQRPAMAPVQVVTSSVDNERIRQTMSDFGDALRQLNEKLVTLTASRKTDAYRDLEEKLGSVKETLSSIYDSRKEIESKVEGLESSVNRLSQPQVTRDSHDIEKMKIIIRGMEDDIASMKALSYKRPAENRGPSPEALARKLETLQKNLATISAKVATLEIPWIPPEMENLPKKLRSAEENMKFVEESMDVLAKRVREIENSGSDVEMKVRNSQKIEEDLILHQQHEVLKMKSELSSRVDEMESRLRQEAAARTAEKIMSKADKDKVNKIVDEYIKSRIDRRAREEFKSFDALRSELQKFDLKTLEERVYVDVLQKLLGSLKNDKRPESK